MQWSIIKPMYFLSIWTILKSRRVCHYMPNRILYFWNKLFTLSISLYYLSNHSNYLYSLFRI